MDGVEAAACEQGVKEIGVRGGGGAGAGDEGCEGDEVAGVGDGVVRVCVCGAEAHDDGTGEGVACACGLWGLQHDVHGVADVFGGDGVAVSS